MVTKEQMQSQLLFSDGLLSMQRRIGGSGWDGSFGRRLDAPKHQFCDATHGMGAPWRYVRTLDAGTGTADEQHGTCSLLIKIIKTLHVYDGSSDPKFLIKSSPSSELLMDRGRRYEDFRKGGALHGRDRQHEPSERPFETR